MLIGACNPTLRPNFIEFHVVRTLGLLFRADCAVTDGAVGALLRDNPVKVELLAAVLVAMASGRWLSPARGETVLHKVVEGCRAGAIGEELALALAVPVLAADPEQLTRLDHSSMKTPGELAYECRDAAKLQRLLAVVVFGKYVLVSPSTEIYRTSTTVIMQCRVFDATGGRRRRAKANLGLAVETAPESLVRQLPLAYCLFIWTVSRAL